MMISRLVARLARWMVRTFFSTEAEDFTAELKNIYERYIYNVKSAIPTHVAELLILVEDRRFYRHLGVDCISLARATWRTFFLGRIEGASTLEQQLWRTISGERELSIRRKLKEIGFATLVGDVIPKRDVPGVYMYVAYFGWRMQGIRQACAQLGYVLEQLTIVQGAELVSRLKWPQPRHHSATFERRVSDRIRHALSLYEIARSDARRFSRSEDPARLR